MDRFKRSWQLAKASWAMLMEDRSLLIYPLISGIAVVVLALLIAIPLAAAGGFTETDDGDFSIVQIVALFVLYFVSYTVITYCNSALVAEVMNRMSGSTTPISGWAFARTRMSTILGYAAIAATVGVVLNILSNRSEGAGKAVAALGGAAWSVATFLVVPILVVERVGPVDALKRSTSLLRRTWGEQIIGSTGIGFVTGIATVIVVAIGVGLAMLAAATGIMALVVIVIALAAVAIAVIAVVSSALDTIYRSAVYRYATDEPIANYAGTDALPAAFRQK